MNILILNVHSALNLGDDAIMRTTLDSLSRAFPQANITIAANDPASWQKYTGVVVVGSVTTWVVRQHAGQWRARRLTALLVLGWLAFVTVAYRLFNSRMIWGPAEQRRLLVAYYNADLVLSCGGGNFYAHRSFSPFFIWALLSLGLALGLGKRVIMLPQSIGPIVGRLQNILARQVFNRVELIMHRERLSLNYVTQNLRVQTHGILVPDLAFGLPLAVASSAQNRSASVQVGITVTDRIAQRDLARQEIYEDILETVLVKLSRAHNAHLHIFSQCYGPSLIHDDRVAAQRLYDRLRRYVDHLTLRETFNDAMALRSAYAQMDCMIGTRMHTAIFAAGSGVPVVLIGYQPKALGVMDWLGLSEYVCDLQVLSAERLYQVATRALQNRREIRQHLLARYEELYAQVNGWTRYLGAG